MYKFSWATQKLWKNKHLLEKGGKGEKIYNFMSPRWLFLKKGKKDTNYDYQAEKLL